MLEKVISGGQTGADFAGLVAGRVLGLVTGGTAPYNWMTADGPQAVRLLQFGLVPGPYDPRIYLLRTFANVRDSDGTVLFGRVNSPGTKLTIRYCVTLKRPYLCNPSSGDLCSWVECNRIRVLNVAGNREHTNPGVTSLTIKTLLDAFGGSA